MTRYVEFTKDRWPTVFEVIDSISHDCGNRCHDSYKINIEDDMDLVILDENDFNELEVKLRELSKEDLQIFAIGDEDDSYDLSQKYDLHKFSIFLNTWFNRMGEGPDVDY